MTSHITWERLNELAAARRKALEAQGIADQDALARRVLELAVSRSGIEASQLWVETVWPTYVHEIEARWLHSPTIRAIKLCKWAPGIWAALTDWTVKEGYKNLWYEDPWKPQMEPCDA